MFRRVPREVTCTKAMVILEKCEEVWRSVSISTGSDLLEDMVSNTNLVFQPANFVRSGCTIRAQKRSRGDQTVWQRLQTPERERDSSHVHIVLAARTLWGRPRQICQCKIFAGIYGRTYVCMSVCMSVCLSVCMYVCMHACMYVCVYVYVCVCICMYMYVLYMYVYVCICMYMYV